MWNLKYETDELIHETQRDSDIDNKCKVTKGGGMNKEFGIKTYTYM